MKFDTVIIGAGLGGLQCAYILAKHGQNVCVVEKNAQIGGCLQTFKRGNHYFDTGFHYVGGLSEGQPLYRLFEYFQLLKLPWYQLDTNAFDEVVQRSLQAGMNAHLSKPIEPERLYRCLEELIESRAQNERNEG